MCVHYFIVYCTYTYVPFVSLLYPTGAASSSDQGRIIVLCQPVHSVGKSLHPQHGSLRAWGYLTVRASCGVGQKKCLCFSVCMLCIANCNLPIYFTLAGHPPLAGFCYGELHNSESASASFDVCELVGTESSCYNDGRV